MSLFQIVPGNAVKSISSVSHLTSIDVAPWTFNRRIQHPYSIFFRQGRRVFYFSDDGVARSVLTLDQCFALINNVFAPALGGFLTVPVVVHPWESK